MVTKVIITDEGDKSIGIRPVVMEITADFELASKDKDVRELDRKMLRDSFKEMYHLIGEVRVQFEDECFHCGKVLKKKNGKYVACACESL